MSDRSASPSPRFVGIDGVIYGVEDMDIGQRFFDDWGLHPISRARDEVVFKTRHGPRVVLRKPESEAFMFPARHSGSALREVVWGVEHEHDLDLIETILSRHGPVKKSANGVVHSIDPFGYGIAFTPWRHEAATRQDATRMNFLGARTRISEPSVHYPRANPARIGHVVFEVAGPDALRAGENFYIDRLGFSASDRYDDKGLFCRCAEENDHHNIAFLTTPNRQTRFQHAAFEVRDIHEVFGGGLHFTECGWDTAIGPGRHKVSSAYFWYFNNPCGGQVEYFSDTDYLDGKWKPRNMVPSSDTIAEWALLDGVSRFKGLPPGR